MADPNCPYIAKDEQQRFICVETFGECCSMHPQCEIYQKRKNMEEINDRRYSKD